MLIFSVWVLEDCWPSSFIIKFFNSVKRNLFWNGSIRTLIQSYLDFSIAAVVWLVAAAIPATAQRVDETKKDHLAGPIVVTAVLVILPGILFWLLWRKKDTFNDREVKDKIGIIYQGY